MPSPPVGSARQRATAPSIDGGPDHRRRASTRIRTAGTSAPRSIALTFDDGPDPRWTPQVLDFSASSACTPRSSSWATAVIDHPDLAAADCRAKGMRSAFIRSRMPRHPDALPSWQRGARAAVDAAGAWSARSGDVDFDLPSALQLDERRTSRTRPWTSIRNRAPITATSRCCRPTTVATGPDRASAQIDGELPEPTASAGEILLMHDGGGDRSQTVEALRTLLSRTQADGYDVTTVAERHRARRHDAARRRCRDRIAGTALIAGVQLSEFVMAIVTVRAARDRRDHPPARGPRRWAAAAAPRCAIHDGRPARRSSSSRSP